MKKTLSIITASGLVLLTSCDEGGKTTGNFKNDQEKLGYCIGVDLGHNVEKAKIDSLDIEAMLNGMRDVLNKKDIKIADAEAKTFMMEYFKKKQLADASAIKVKAAKFFEDNKKKDGVQTLPSGLQYQVVKAGTGPKPTINDQVTVHYEGKLLDGKVFDSSLNGEPATFPVGGVITGWTEALTLMPVGSKWKLFIPSNLAYGEAGGGPIGPNEPLIFEVELLEIKK